MKKILCFTTIIFLLVCSSVFGADVKLTWDPNSETDLAGYRVYRADKAGGPYKQAGADVMAPDVVFTDTNLSDGTFFWVVTAFDADGNESGYSNEVTKRIDTTPPEPPQDLLEQALDLAIQSLQKYKEYLSVLRVE